MDNTEAEKHRMRESVAELKKGKKESEVSGWRDRKTEGKKESEVSRGGTYVWAL